MILLNQNVASKPFSLTVNALVFMAFAGTLAISSWLSTLVYIVALLGLASLVQARVAGSSPLPAADKEIRLIGFGFTLFGVVALAAWALNGFQYEDFRKLGTAGRMLLFWPLLVAMTHSRLSRGTVFAALVSAALVTGFVAFAEVWAGGNGRVSGASNPIPFGNVALLLGAFMLIGITYSLKTGNRYMLALTTVALLAALSAALLTQTRSNLLALPVVFVLILLWDQRKLAAALTIPLAALLLLLLDGRLMQTLTDFLSGQVDQGISLRLLIWQEAWQVFLSSPLTGAGLNGYVQALQSGIAAGDLPAAIGRCCLGHAHNDVLHNLATKGLLGGLSYALLMLIPLVQFFKLVNHPSIQVAFLARAGAIIPLAYLIFGLTEATTARGIYVTFYLLSISAISYLLYHTFDAAMQQPRKQRLSATIITKNEEDHIGACLASVQAVADEIIVLDSGSSDRTVEIARQYTDRVESTDWPGFGVQKQRALERATGDWVLSIDADERITPGLAREINHHLSAHPDADAYRLPWAVTIYGRQLDFGRSGRAPLRLFRRDGVRFSDALVHEKILIPQGRKIRTLRGRLTHYTHRNYAHSLEKSAKYAWLGAQEKHRQGKKTRTLFYPTLRGLLTFVQVYVLRFGFLDGQVGYLTAVTYAQVTFNKYAGLWTLTKK